MTTLRDALASAIDKAEDGTLQAPTEASIESDDQSGSVAPEKSEEAQSSRARDEQGRFAAKTEQAEVTQRKPPSSWKKDYWGHWDKLGTDPELKTLQDYIEQREGEFAKGVSTYKTQWEQAQPLVKALEPFMADLQRSGIPPDRWIQNLGAAHHALSVGTPEQRAQMFVKLASDYGVNLQGLTGSNQNPQIGYLAQALNQLQNQFQHYRGQAEQQETARMQSMIDEFAATAPHFEALKPTMSELLRSGMATDLKTAYDKAIRLNDEVWQQHQAEQAKAAEASRQAEIAKKKAAAVSPRSTSPTGSMAAGNAKKGLREQLSEAYESVAGGRF